VWLDSESELRFASPFPRPEKISASKSSNASQRICRGNQGKKRKRMTTENDADAMDVDVDEQRQNPAAEVCEPVPQTGKDIGFQVFKCITEDR
jgi:hypothetical protein